MNDNIWKLCQYHLPKSHDASRKYFQTVEIQPWKTTVPEFCCCSDAVHHCPTWAGDHCYICCAPEHALQKHWKNRALEHSLYSLHSSLARYCYICSEETEKNLWTFICNRWSGNKWNLQSDLLNSLAFSITLFQLKSHWSSSITIKIQYLHYTSPNSWRDPRWHAAIPYLLSESIRLIWISLSLSSQLFFRPL